MFYFDKKNYLMKLRTDLHFINTSVLQKYIPFSFKYDPFFVFPYKAIFGKKKVFDNTD